MNKKEFDKLEKKIDKFYLSKIIQAMKKLLRDSKDNFDFDKYAFSVVLFEPKKVKAIYRDTSKAGIARSYAMD